MDGLKEGVLDKKKFLGALCLSISSSCNLSLSLRPVEGVRVRTVVRLHACVHAPPLLFLSSGGISLEETTASSLFFISELFLLLFFFFLFVRFGCAARTLQLESFLLAVLSLVQNVWRSFKAQQVLLEKIDLGVLPSQAATKIQAQVRRSSTGGHAGKVTLLLLPPSGPVLLSLSLFLPFSFCFFLFLFFFFFPSSVAWCVCFSRPSRCP